MRFTPHARLVSGLALALCLTGDAWGQIPRDRWPSEDPPPPLPAREVSFPPYQLQTLENGLRVVAVLHHEQPIVSLRLLVGAGAAHDPVEQPGVANLVASLLTQGAGERSAQEIAETIDTIGGGLGAGAGTDVSFVNVVVMKDSFGLAMDLLADVVRRPAFAPEELERQRQQLLSSLQVSQRDPDFVARTVFDRLVYGFHPYGRPATGVPASIATITREDVVAFHEQYFAPNESYLAIVGDLTADEAFAEAERVFGDWARKAVPAVEPEPAPPPTRRVVVVDMPGAVQTEIRVGHLGVSRREEDYTAVDLAVRILGGEGANRLHRVLRSERGLTYGASVELHARRQTGDFMAETDTRSEATAEALRLITEEFWRIRRQRVHPRELSDAQAYMTGSYPLRLETPDALALQILNVLFYGLDLREPETYRERVNAVSVGDVQDAAERFLQPDRLSVVLVGDASAFVDDLRGIGFADYEQIALEDLDLASATLRRGGASVGTSGDGGAERLPIDRLIARAVAAKGGLARLDTIRTVKATGRTTMFAPEGPTSAETVTYIRYPNEFRIEAALPGGRIAQIFAGGQAWVESPAGGQAPPESVRRAFAASARRDMIPLLLDVSAGRIDLRPLPSTEGRVTVEVLEDGEAQLTMDIDPLTGLVVRQAYVDYGPDGVEQTEELFSDYRSIDGVQVAFRAVVRRAGVTIMERALTDFVINTTLDDALFRIPAEPR